MMRIVLKNTFISTEEFTVRRPYALRSKSHESVVSSRERYAVLDPDVKVQNIQLKRLNRVINPHQKSFDAREYRDLTDLPESVAIPSATELKWMQRRLEKACQVWRSAVTGERTHASSMTVMSVPTVYPPTISHESFSGSASTNTKPAVQQDIGELICCGALRRQRCCPCPTACVLSAASGLMSKDVSVEDDSNSESSATSYDFMDAAGTGCLSRFDRPPQKISLVQCIGEAGHHTEPEPAMSCTQQHQTLCLESAQLQQQKALGPSTALPSLLPSRLRQRSCPESAQSVSCGCSLSQCTGPANAETTLLSSSQILPHSENDVQRAHARNNSDIGKLFSLEKNAARPTTLMLRNLPKQYTKQELISELLDLGFADAFNFIYLPVDKVTMANGGYAFINFIDHEWADQCTRAFHKYRFKKHNESTPIKNAAISVAHIQGLEANLAHYKDSTVNKAEFQELRPVVMVSISSALLSERE